MNGKRGQQPYERVAIGEDVANKNRWGVRPRAEARSKTTRPGEAAESIAGARSRNEEKEKKYAKGGDREGKRQD